MPHIYDNNPSYYMTSASWTKGVKFLIIANLVAFGIQILSTLLPDSWVSRSFILDYFGLTPQRVIGDLWVWQLVTSIFLHNNSESLPLHLIFNLLTLYFFGPIVERYYGTRRFLQFYFACGIVASLTYTIFHFITGTINIAIGASGAIMGIMVIAAFLEPNAIVYFFFVLPLKLKTIVLLLIGIDIYMTLRPGTAIASVAHLGGALFGYLYYRLSDRIYIYLNRLEHLNARHRSVKEQKKEKDIRQEVDKLLDKISEKGIGSLTSREKRFLQDASREYRKDLKK